MMLINTKFFEVYSGIESELKQNIENRAKSLNIVEVDESINMITGKAYETLMKELGDVPENLDLDDYEAWIKSGESTDEFKVLRFMLLASITYTLVIVTQTLILKKITFSDILIASKTLKHSSA